MILEMSLGLQEALHARLAAALTVPVFDAVPGGTAPETYVLLGEEDCRDASDASGAGLRADFRLSVLSREAGFAGAKAVAAEIYEALTTPALMLEGARLVGLWFLSAKAQRLEQGRLRRIDLTFRARIDGI